MERFILIDGHAILYRAFHALPSLTTSKGDQVGAVFGFCSMLLRVIKDLKPKYLVVTFDLPKPTFRQTIFVGYQAQRPKMATVLKDQVELVHEVLRVMGIPIFEVEGYEADDVIGTLAAQAVEGQKTQNTQRIRKSGNQKIGVSDESDIPTHRQSEFFESSEILEVIIVSGDRDMLQLVNDHVKVLAPVAGITQMVLYDAPKVEEKYGLKPSQWVDCKALVGDPSDNYPGVSGVGPKTAAELLREYGSLENLYQNLGKLPEKQARALAEGAEAAGLAKKLAQIVTDVPLKLDLAKCQLPNFKTPKVEKLFQELEFKSLWERLEKNNGESPVQNSQLTLL